MGMFDYVKYTGKCPKCGAEITDWQSKDGPCSLGTLEPWQVKWFYGHCPKCEAWVDAYVEAEVEHIVKKCEVKLVLDKRLCGDSKSDSP